MNQNRIATLRREKGIKQTELAALTGETQSRISRWELDRQKITVEQLERVCKALGVTVEDALRGK